ncbi:chloride channel protein [Streptomyces meridianus]|uniref:Chloride channel protein n=1 Tax=Streptomyces meridianus TaxID=2938945 RepID=A0ABT0X7D3_9ACTN|nr:chloride channel protein [Streptomyces meridianus]MCM2578436.1 chloride channel protein [Streptomyces meridianus]
MDGGTRTAAGTTAGGGTVRVRTGRSSLATGIREAPWGLTVLALTVGAGAGLGSIAFRWLIETFTRLFSGHADYAGAGHAANPHVPGLGPYFVVLAPVLGGLLYGPLVDRFAKEARGHGVPEVMLAVAQRGGRINPNVSVVKALASALCIGSGGSVGREGPIVQIGSALGSTLGRMVAVAEGRMRLLVACGAAGGIAATFNAPLAGVFFAMELILSDFAVDAFGAVVLASVSASVIGRAAFGDTAFLTLPAFHVDHVAQYLLFALLGIVAGLVGVGFTRVLYAVEDACDWAWRGPEWLRPAVGGLLLGLLLLVLPEMYGVGYPVLEKATRGDYVAVFLLLLLAGKILATALTIGIGGSGGVFAPSLFIGAMLGAAFGSTVHGLLPGTAGAVGAYALVGMGAVFAGSSRAPITAVVILFELTGQYSIILPLMLAIVTATLTSRLLSRDTVYTLKLRRRGIDLAGPAPRARLGSRTVSSVMEGLPPTLPAFTALDEAAPLLSLSEHGVLPVLDSDGRYLGTLTARSVAEALAESPGDGPAPPETAGELAELPTPVTADMALATALHALVAAPGTGLPVLDADRTRLVGWLTHQSALRAVHPPAPA